MLASLFWRETKKKKPWAKALCFSGKTTKKDFVLLNYFVFKVFSCFFGFSVLFLFLQLMLIGHPGTKINEKKLRKVKKKYNKELNNLSNLMQPKLQAWCSSFTTSPIVLTLLSSTLRSFSVSCGIIVGFFSSTCSFFSRIYFHN